MSGYVKTMLLGLAVLVSSPIAMAANDPGRPTDDQGAPIVQDSLQRVAAEPGAETSPSEAAPALDLSSILESLENEIRPEVALPLSDVSRQRTRRAGPGDPNNPLGTSGPWFPYVGAGEPVDTASPFKNRLSRLNGVDAYQGYAGLDYSVSPLTSLSLRYRAISPENDPEFRPTDTEYFTHNLELGLHLDF